MKVHYIVGQKTKSNKTSEIIQVNDDHELLALMMKDIRKTGPLYKPANYWFNFQEHLYEELQKDGLKDFRQRKNSDLVRFL